MRPRPAYLALAAIVAAGLALRIVYASESLLGDELFTLDHSDEGSFGAMMDSADRVEYTPPLYFVLAWLAAKLGDPQTAIRVPAIVLGTATIPLVFVLARRAAEGLGRAAGGRAAEGLRRPGSGDAAGLVAAAGFALSPFALFYGSEARSYGAAAFFVALAAVLLLGALERERARGWWIGFAAALAAIALSHYTAIAAALWLAAWAAYAHRDRLRPLLAACAGAAAAFLVWVPFAPTFSAPDVVGAFWPLTLGNAASAAARSLYGVNPPVALGDAPGVLPAIVLTALVLVAAAAVAARLRGDGPRTPLAMLAGLALATPAALLAYSLVSTDILVARSLFPTAPAAFAVIGAGLAMLPRPALLGCAAAGLAALAAGALAAHGPDARRPQYGEAAAFIERSTRPGDPVLDAEVFPERAPRRALEIHLSRPVIETDAADPRAALARADRAAVAGFPSVRGGEAFDLPVRAGLRPVERRVFRGSVDLHVAIYARP